MEENMQIEIIDLKYKLGFEKLPVVPPANDVIIILVPAPR